MQDRIRALAEFDAGDMPFLSIYLDVRPEGIGESPGQRDSLVVLRDRLREIGKTFTPARGDGFDSFTGDVERINAFTAGEMDAATEGLAIFACGGYGIFDVFQFLAPFENQVTVAPKPDLYQLARFDDEYETAVVAVVDSNSARLFVSRYGKLTETETRSDDDAAAKRTQVGGWSQSGYQRHIDNSRDKFGKEAAQAIAELCERERPGHVIIAGDESATRTIELAMPKHLASIVRTVIRANMRITPDELARQVEPILAVIEEEAGASVVERLVGEVRRNGLGTAGLTGTTKALERGQVDTVVIESSALGEEERAELVRQAALTGATVEVVDDSEPLRQLGGVGALLRYRI